VTQEQFYDIALFQLEELWSTYGNNGALFEIWFDGGLPSDSNFTSRILALYNKYQPNAAAFNGFPQITSNPVRWIGTESGSAPDPNWSTGSCDQGDCTGNCPPDGGDPTSPQWCPAEIDSTMQQNDQWFFIPGYPVHPLSDLVASYHASIGHNGNWILDIAPPPNSTVAPTHMAQYSNLGSWIRTCYGKPLAAGSMAAGGTVVTVTLPTATMVNRVRLQEDQSKGQLIRTYTVEGQNGAGGAWFPLSSGTAVGATKIDVFATVTLTAFRVTTNTAPTGLGVAAFACLDPTN
jgi:alpha-L-fucosidase